MSLTETERDRYLRHILLKELGGPGQNRLKSATVAIVGAGGLGAPASLYLAAAGIGRLILIDDDVVELSNLQRQILFSTADVGHPKVARAAAALQALNPHVEIIQRRERLTEANAEALLANADLALDGTDSFTTRFAINAACVAARRPLVSGAVGRWEGQVGIFLAAADAPCYRCLVPAAPPDAETCGAMGVVGALTGVIGAMMALEAVKLLARAGAPLAGRLLVFQGLTGQARTLAVARDPGCPACGGAHD